MLDEDERYITCTSDIDYGSEAHSESRESKTGRRNGKTNFGDGQTLPPRRLI